MVINHLILPFVIARCCGGLRSMPCRSVLRLGQGEIADWLFDRLKCVNRAQQRLP